MKIGTGMLLLATGCGASWRVEAPTIEMPDGTRLAADVLLPEDAGEGLPIVLVQTRYWRSFETKFRRSEGALPIQPREPVARELLEAGYGVVLIDVRGTGASEGAWQRPWSEAEVGDMGAVIDWIAAQDWCDGSVGTYGVSYEGSTALLAASQGRPALRAVLAREIEWDVLDELLAPGGVRNISFVERWGATTAALDRGEYPDMFPASGKPFVAGPRRTDDDPDGERLAELLADRTVADVAADVADVRLPDDPYGAEGPPIGEMGPSARAEALAGGGAALGLWGGWWDGATGDAVLRADLALDLADARIGPWTHQGDRNASPLGGYRDREARVDLADVVAFFDAHLAGDDETRHRAWWVAGAERWETGEDWPAAEPVRWPLRGDGTLGGEPDPELSRTLDVDFAAQVGEETRWTAGLLTRVRSPDRAEAPGLLSWSTGPLGADLSVFGAPELACDVALEAPEAALHVYLEAVDRGGRVRLLTEGVRRVGEGPVTVPLRAVAFELAADEGLRLSIAGADAGTFERIPAEGAQRITLRGEACALDLPER